MVEVMTAIVILAIVMSVAFTGDRGQLQHVASAFRETKASRLAAGRLEVLRDPTRVLATGDSEFVLADDVTRGLGRAIGTQSVRRLEPGLFEAVVTVSWLPPGAGRRRRVQLTTWIERESDR